MKRITELCLKDKFRSTLTRRDGVIERFNQNQFVGGVLVYWFDTDRLQTVHPALLVQPLDMNRRI